MAIISVIQEVKIRIITEGSPERKLMRTPSKKKKNSECVEAYSHSISYVRGVGRRS
jgi:hypothetical protein